MRRVAGVFTSLMVRSSALPNASGRTASTMRRGLFPSLSITHTSFKPPASARKNAILEPSGETAPPLALSISLCGLPPRRDTFHRLRMALVLGGPRK